MGRYKAEDTYWNTSTKANTKVERNKPGLIEGKRAEKIENASPVILRQGIAPSAHPHSTPLRLALPFTHFVSSLFPSHTLSLPLQTILSSLEINPICRSRLAAVTLVWMVLLPRPVQLAA